MILGIMCLVAGAVLLAAQASSAVNPRNLNFYISYTDIIMSPSDFEITRTYNSRAIRTLSFGYGWGWPLDTDLQVNADGSVTVNENGSGATRQYFPVGQTLASIAEQVSWMVAVMEQQGWLSSDVARNAAQAELMRDADMRRRVQAQLVRENLISRPDIAVGTRLVSLQEPGVEILREAAGFYRTRPGGFDRFDTEGRLMEVSHATQTGFRLSRNWQGHLREIILPDGTTIAISTNADGQIIAAESGGMSATYVYDDRARLIRAVNIEGTAFDYDYDDAGRMTRIGYENGTSLLTYYEAETGFVTRQELPDGRARDYSHFSNTSADPQYSEEYGTEIRHFSAAQHTQPHTVERMVYQYAVDSLGNSYTARTLRTVNGITTETRYHPCGLPTLRQDGNRIAEFDYDADCRVTMRRADGQETRYTYDARSGKITSVTETNLNTGWQTSNSFEYDLRGQLVRAQNSAGESVDLHYDAAQRIIRIERETGDVLNFTYDANNKPIVIEIPGIGTLDIEYDAAGEIVRVDSPDGHAAAMQITQTFQSLLAMVQAADISFGL